MEMTDKQGLDLMIQIPQLDPEAELIPVVPNNDDCTLFEDSQEIKDSQKEATRTRRGRQKHLDDYGI